MLWSRKSEPVYDRIRAVGLDLTASRVRAEALGSKCRPLVLDEPETELPLFIAGERRVPVVGRAAVALCRRLPHVVCANFLASLNQPREWKIGRHTLTAEMALGLIFETIRKPVLGETEAIGLALPAYLAPAQVTQMAATAHRAKLPLKGTTVGALALVADNAASLLRGSPPSSVRPWAEWVVPLRSEPRPAAVVVVVDVDECALSAVLVQVNPDRVKIAAAAAWPRLAHKIWKDRLLDAVADRCVRLCRRDPRDSAEAEQSLYDQLDNALDRCRAGQRISLTIRTAHWFQDILLQPEEFESYCHTLSRLAGESIRDFIHGSGLLEPPAVVWLTDAAGRLPGLVGALHANTSEATAIEVLPPHAVAAATAALVPRWLAGDLPRTHLDNVIPLELPTALTPHAQPGAK
ncbi:MAG: hypothetical protein RMJ56_06265 [Gemmataceae bacterium]|nr:hypothetical protein [Gemmata sp.]MDW8197193.1 hypothetical protein [Gemmataceae bacterium]